MDHGERWARPATPGRRSPLEKPDEGHLPRIGSFRAASDLVRASIAENTRRAYEAALRGFEESGYPETDAGVAAYLTGLFEKGRSAACASMAVAALRFRARLHGRSSPVGPSALRALAGFRRLGSERGRGQVAGVRWEEADLAASLAEGTGTLGGVQFLGAPTVERIRAWLARAGIEEGALFRPVYKGGAAPARAPDGQEHPGRHRAVGEGRGRRGARERPQPPGGGRAEPGERGGLLGRDAARRPLALAGHAGPLRAGADRETGRRGEAALRAVRPTPPTGEGGFSNR